MPECLKRPLLLLASACLCAAAPSSDPLHRATYKEIVQKYTFVGDFNVKPLEREVSDELLWRYPLKIQPITFELDSFFTDIKNEIPAVRGTGMVYQHINMGRTLFLEGNYEEARKVWLSAKARFGTTYPEHRYVDYLIGYAFLGAAETIRKAKHLTLADREYRSTLANVATFLSWAFVVKKDVPDPVVERASPKGIYNLAAIYFNVGRAAGAFGAAQQGLDFLRKTGRREYRPQFHRLIAEAYIKNSSWLEAVQQLDQGIRQDSDPKQGSAMFARVGDIYFNLNNYELAEDAYALANRIDQEQNHVDPSQFIMRGEALFWLGRFSEAQKVLFYGLNAYRVSGTSETPPVEHRAYGQLRIADAYLTRRELEKARLEYFRVSNDYRGTEAARLAKIRGACLELPFYEGKNIQHARELLDETKAQDLPAQMKELAWACHVNSFATRERTPEMVERVRTFANQYPTSRFLRSMAEPIRQVQATRIEPFFDKGDLIGAITFFEANRKVLFPKPEDKLQRRLFAAYADVMKSEGAKEFWQSYAGSPDTDLKVLRMAAVTSELAERAKDRKWSAQAVSLAKSLKQRRWQAGPSDMHESYVQRILATKLAGVHTPWVFDLVKTWSGKNNAYTCSILFELTSKQAASSQPLVPVNKTIIETIARLGQAGAGDDNCLLSWLELEQRTIRTKRGELGVRYLTRLNWSLNNDLTPLFWSAAEDCSSAGNATCATTLWQHLRDKAPPSSTEAKLSQVRLDPTRTELEGLFNQ